MAKAKGYEATPWRDTVVFRCEAISDAGVRCQVDSEYEHKMEAHVAAGVHRFPTGVPAAEVSLEEVREPVIPEPLPKAAKPTKGKGKP